MHKRKLTVAVLAGLAVTAMTMNLTACGGGGGNGAVKPSTPVAPTVTNYNENVATGSTSTIGDNLDGAGNMTLTGGGTLVLTGTNTFTGGTTITSSTLQLGSGGTTGSIVGDVADNGALVFDRSNDLTFSGVISGYGKLIQQGTGTLTLTGVNTYTSSTFLENGTLALAGAGSIADSFMVQVNSGTTFDVSGTTSGTSITTLTGNGSVVLGGKTLTLTNQGGNEFSGVISGTGGVALTGGELVLTGANTYSGLTTIGQNTWLQVGNGNSGASIVSDVSNEGTLELHNSDNWVFGGVISGDGEIQKDDSGNLTLTGANTFTGTLAIRLPSTLLVSNDANLGAPSAAIALEGTLETTGSFSLAQALTLGSGDGSTLRTDSGTILTIPNAINGNGNLTKSGAGTLLLTGNSVYGQTTISEGTLQLGDGGTSGSVLYGVDDNASLVFDRSDVFDYGGVISGTGSVTQSGTGTLVLTGSLTYSGGTTVGNGTFQATQSLPGDVAVNVGGILDAVPGIKGNLANAGKVVIHGGNTAVGGSFTQASTGKLAVSLGSGLAITGSATLNGGTLEVTGADNGYVANSHTDVLTASGGVTGTFDQLVKDSGVVFTSTTIGYGANDVWLDTTGLNIAVATHAMGIVDPASVDAAQRVEAGFESINNGLSSGSQMPSGVLQGAGDIQHSATPTIAHASLQSLSGQLHAASAAMLFDGIDASGNAVTSHFDDLLAGRVRLGVWESNLGAQGNLQRSGYEGTTFSSSGVMAGADMRIGTHAVLGVAAGQSRGFGQLDSAWDHNRTSMENVGVYGGLVNGPWYASARVATGWYREDMQRLVQLGSFGAPVGSGFTGRYIAGSLEGGRMFNVGMTRVVPFVNVRYQSLNLGGFAEQGAMGFGLEAGARTAGRLQTGVGLRAVRSWRLGNGMRLGFDGSAGWQHTLHQYGSVFDASFTGFSNWLPVEGVGLSRDTTVLRAGLSMWPSRNFGLRLGFTREQGQRQDANSALLQGTIRF